MLVLERARPVIGAVSQFTINSWYSADTPVKALAAMTAIAAAVVVVTTTFQNLTPGEPHISFTNNSQTEETSF